MRQLERAMRVCRAGFLIALAILWIVSGGFCQAQVPPNVTIEQALAHFTPLWESYKPGPTTAELEFDEYFVGEPDKLLSQQELQSLIEHYELRTSCDQLKPMMRLIAKSDFRDDYPSHKLWVDGPLNRYEMAKTTYVVDHDYFIRHSVSNKQMHVYFRGQSPIGFRRLDNFRVFPLRSLDNPQLTKRTDDSVWIETQTTKELFGATRKCNGIYEFDWETGLPIYFSDQIDGRRTQELYQLQISRFEGAGPFAVLTIEVKYNWSDPIQGAVDLTLTRIRSARFQIPIPNNTFVLPKPREVEVFDHRLPGAYQCLFLDTTDSDDVRKLLPNSKEKLGTVIPTISPTRRWLTILHGLLLVCLGIWLWRRIALKSAKREHSVPTGGL